MRSFASRVFRYGAATARAERDPAQMLLGALIQPKVKHFAAITGWSKKATFASDEDIYHYLGVHIGSCSVFGIINDKKNHITVVLENAIGHADPDDIINFHPNVNTVTVSITIRDMFRFLEWSGNRVILEP